MSVTADTPVIEADQLDEAEYEAALERLREFRRQLARADKQADAGSLDRAADLAMVFSDPEKRWVKEMDVEHPVKRTHFRGRPVNPEGRSRFSTWVKERLDFMPTYSYYLLNAHELAGIVFTRVKTNQPTTAKPLRPLYKLLKEERGHEAPDIWRRALELADGQSPTEAQVRQALRDHDKATGRTPATRTGGYYKRTVKEARAKILREFDWILEHGSEEDIKAVLIEMQRHLAELNAELATPKES